MELLLLILLAAQEMTGPAPGWATAATWETAEERTIIDTIETCHSPSPTLADWLSRLQAEGWHLATGSDLTEIALADEWASLAGMSDEAVHIAAHSDRSVEEIAISRFVGERNIWLLVNPNFQDVGLEVRGHERTERAQTSIHCKLLGTPTSALYKVAHRLVATAGLLDGRSTTFTRSYAFNDAFLPGGYVTVTYADIDALSEILGTTQDYSVSVSSLYIPRAPTEATP